jgi:hypothetical protein
MAWPGGRAKSALAAVLSWRCLVRRLFVGDEPKAQGR